MAVFLPKVQSACTAPHLVAPLIVPGAAAVQGSTFAANQPVAQSKFTGVLPLARWSLLFGGASSRISPCEFLSYCIEQLPLNDGIMVVLDEVHGELAFVLDHLFGDAVFAKGLLQQDVTAVFLIGEDSSDGSFVPAFSPGGDPVLNQLLCNCFQAGTSEEGLVDLPDNFRFLWDDFWRSVLSTAVSVEASVLDDCFSLTHSLPLTPGHISADGLALALGKGSIHSHKNLTADLHGIYVLFLEYNSDSHAF